MGAPVGNQFWKLRSKHGRDKLFATPELLWEAACEYFEWCDKNSVKAFENKGTRNVNQVELIRPYTIVGLCIYCDASSHWFNEFRKAADKDFLVVIHKIESIIYDQKFVGAAIGIFNHNIIARDLGLSDKSEVNIPQLHDLPSITLIPRERADTGDK